MGVSASAICLLVLVLVWLLLLLPLPLFLIMFLLLLLLLMLLFSLLLLLFLYLVSLFRRRHDADMMPSRFKGSNTSSPSFSTPSRRAYKAPTEVSTAPAESLGPRGPGEDPLRVPLAEGRQILAALCAVAPACPSPSLGL